MKLDVLICTYNERIVHVPDVLLPYRPDVSYIVSMQYTDKKYFQYIPGELKNRRDVKLIFLDSRDFRLSPRGRHRPVHAEHRRS